jgi:hypothetical protein
MMKQAEGPKSREGIKKELNSGVDISDDPGTMAGGVLKTKPDKEEGFEDTTKDTAEVDKDMVKQDSPQLSSTGRKFLKPGQSLQEKPTVNIQRTGG